MPSPEEIHYLLHSSDFELVHEEGNRYRLATDRLAFAILFKEFGYKTGAEIGVQAGDNSQQFVSLLEGPIYLIDSWKEWPKEVYDDIANVNQAEQDKRHKFVCNLFKNKNVKVIRKTSIEALDEIKDKSLDFVFIDANHEYDFIKDDLNGWWKKLKTFGAMSGHDVTDTRGVEKALYEFVEQKKLKYWYIAGNSYFFIKPDN